VEPVETPPLTGDITPPLPASVNASHGSNQSPHTPPPIHDHSRDFGDPITCLKSDNTLRIGFNNIGGFPVLNERNDKVQSIKNFMANYNLDVFGGCESNVNWPLLPDQARLSQWFRDANQCRSHAANNIHEKFGHYRSGGTFWICAGHATHHLAQAEKDPSGLGRWVVCTIQS